MRKKERYDTNGQLELAKKIKFYYTIYSFITYFYNIV